MSIQTDFDAVDLLSELRPRREWSDLFNWPSLTQTGLKILGALFIGWIAYSVLRLLLKRVERSLGEAPGGAITLQEQRTRTIVSLLRSVGIVVITVIVIFMVLSAIGLELGPLLAGAGVIGLAFSFGAQSLVKDVISGLFMLFENQFAVGDVIRIDDVSGAVERVTLRVVVLRDVQGIVHTIPNGEIKRVSNLTRSFSRAVFEVGVAYKEDADRVMQVMREVGREMWEDPEWSPILVEEIVVPGIESFGDSAVNIRIMATTLPLKQWEVARELRRRLKRRFDEEAIEIPYPHRTFYWGEGQTPAPVDA
ncbi:MAG: mechanosensitive ion channel, partial [Gemmatimonadota bacterium]|nr:mechanosensitive ion channel [Gemmatimonadota bacterium]